METIVTEFAPNTRSKKKLLKSLSKLRKKAGKLRDLDVQIAFLKALSMPDRSGHRAKMLECLCDERARRARKMEKLFDAEVVSDVRKRLRRAQAELNVDGIDPLRLAYERLPHPAHALNEKALHMCRIEAKRARYLAELGDSAAAKSFVEELKRAQDQIGEWHDVVKLKELAEERFGGVHDSPLVAALQNIARARFRRAVSSLLTALAKLGAGRKEPETKIPHKPAVSEVSAQAAVA